jgi:hypothetical protein
MLSNLSSKRKDQSPYTLGKKNNVISKNHLDLAISSSKNYLRGHYHLKKQKGEKERKINAPLI